MRLRCRGVYLAPDAVLFAMTGPAQKQFLHLKKVVKPSAESNHPKTTPFSRFLPKNLCVLSELSGLPLDFEPSPTVIRVSSASIRG